MDMTEDWLQPLDIARLQHADSRWLAAYWRSKAGGGDLPACASLRPQEMRGVMPHLMTVKPVGAAGDLRYDQVGGAITWRFGIDLTGRALPADAAGWAAVMRRAAAARQPAAIAGRIAGRMAGGWARFEALALPTACADGARIAVLAGLFFFAE